jgi:alpha-1,2-mannosyltransferase
VQRANLGTVAAGAAFVVSAALCCAPLAGPGHLVDLHVYRMGGDAVLHDMPLYGLRYAGQLPFTYPPFGALVFTSLAWLPWGTAAALITAATVVALPVLLYLALRLPPSPLRGSRAAWDAALAAAALAIWLEPVRSTLFYGQVDVFIACAVLFDLTRPDTSPVKGMAIGLAAAFKLTPALFAVYLLLTGRYRAAALPPRCSPAALPWVSRFSRAPPPISGTSPSCGPGGSARPRTPRIRACLVR